MAVEPKSPPRIAHGIRSSYRLIHCDTATLTSVEAKVTETRAPSYVVVDRATGVLRAVWE